MIKERRKMNELLLCFVSPFINPKTPDVVGAITPVAPEVVPLFIS